ncbi:MAG: helix-turn-helix transcriptional regulator [Acidobacteriota bacterium]|nr:MAG: helix-turn-helix transcriptional regulator [Acidobacteriota bacterium]
MGQRSIIDVTVSGSTTMTYFQRELERIRAEVYANDWQIRNIIETRRFLLENFDRSISLDDISHARFTSKFHLLRLFKRYYGQTPSQFVTELRIAKAKELLRSGRSVTETCFEIGFESPASFSNLFRTRVGLAPKNFQKMSNIR